MWLSMMFFIVFMFFFFFFFPMSWCQNPWEAPGRFLPRDFCLGSSDQRGRWGQLEVGGLGNLLLDRSWQLRINCIFLAKKVPTKMRKTNSRVPKHIESLLVAQVASESWLKSFKSWRFSFEISLIQILGPRIWDRVGTKEFHGSKPIDICRLLFGCSGYGRISGGSFTPGWWPGESVRQAVNLSQSACPWFCYDLDISWSSSYLKTSISLWKW